jgi:lactobin A/cerein 7B family class IIb bacteriocin
MSVNEIRELTDADLNEVAGGVDPVSVAVGAALALGVYILAYEANQAGVFDSVPVGDWISGKGRPA